jgi:prepilin-type N-terminal cleavage/methylation domain-containing protein
MSSLVSTSKYKTPRQQEAFSLLEILVVLSIVSTMLTIMTYGVIKFRQVIITNNATKEYVLNIRKARRYAINNVVTSDGYQPQSYVIQRNSGAYVEWISIGKNGTTLQASTPSRITSVQYSDVFISDCVSDTGEVFTRIKFMAVTGEFVFLQQYSSADLLNAAPGYTSPNVKFDRKCSIKVYIATNWMTTIREIEVDGKARTIKIK